MPTVLRDAESPATNCASSLVALRNEARLPALSVPVGSWPSVVTAMTTALSVSLAAEIVQARYLPALTLGPRDFVANPRGAALGAAVTLVGGAIVAPDGWIGTEGERDERRSVVPLGDGSANQ